MFRRRSMPGRLVRLLLVAALIAACSTVLTRAAASAYTGADFANELLNSCPKSGITPSTITGAAASCTFVPLDASGRPIDTANGNGHATPDPANVTTYWTPAKQFGNHTPNCSMQNESGSLSQEASSSTTTSLQWSYGASVELAKTVSVDYSFSLGLSFTTQHSEAVTAQTWIPPYFALDWYVAKHMQHVRGAMKVVLKKWVADPANPAGGAHKNWYSGVEIDAPAPDPTGGRFVSLTNSVLPMTAYAVRDCKGSALSSQPLVSKYGTEHGDGAGGYCATVTPEVLSIPCAAGPGALQDEQQLTFLPVATTTGATRYMIMNVASGSCLAASPDGAESAVLSVPCNSESLAQLWLSVPVTVTYGVAYTWQWVNASSNLCMNAWASQPAPKYGVNQQRCAATSTPGADTQVWAYSAQPFPHVAG